jgi:hypothetical protein
LILNRKISGAFLARKIPPAIYGGAHRMILGRQYGISPSETIGARHDFLASGADSYSYIAIGG